MLYLTGWKLQSARKDIFTNSVNERGKVCYPLKVLGDTDKTGTTVTFYPDATIFETIDFDYNTLKRRLKGDSFPNKEFKNRLNR